MVRKLALAVALALGSASFTVSGLGLGELKSKSQLNQAFDADIDLLSVDANEIDTVKVKLASEDAFKRAGVDRSYALSQLRFSPELTAAGRTVIHVTSDYPIREPYLNFLIEVNWPRGRLLREYTVLLDPPTTTRRQAPHIAASTALRPQDKRPTAIVRQRSEQPPVSEYGPVRRNETLWGIAEQVRPSGVSMNQMMMSLFEMNPQAFLDKNINKLRRGEILRVPDRDEILHLSRSQANAMFREQQESWVAEQNAGAAEGPGADTSSGKGTSAEQAGSTAAPGAKTADHLRIASPQPQTTQEAGAVETDAQQAPTIDDLNNQVLLAREQAESSRQEAELLRERVESLRVQLADMQRLVTLKDDQLARIQGSVAADDTAQEGSAEAQPLSAEAEVGKSEVAGEVEGALEPGSEPELAVTPESAAEPETGVAPESTVEPPLSLEPVTAPETAELPSVLLDSQTGSEIDDATTDILTDEPVTETVTEGELASDQSETEPAPADTNQYSAPVAESPPDETVPMDVAEEPAPTTPVQVGWKEKVRDMIGVTPDAPVLVGFGAGIIALGGLIGVLIGRRGRKRRIAPPTEPGSTAATALLDDDSPSALSELHSQDLEGLAEDAENVDPISEADVFIAYGRYQQAEKLLRKAIDKEPQRLALSHKLLEVYYATRDVTAYVGLAGEIMAEGRDQVDPAAWERAKEMGRELDPNNVMFTAVAGAASVAGSQLNESEGQGNDESLELDDAELSELTRDLEEDAVSERAEDLSLELNEAVDQVSAQVDQESVAIEDLESLDLDLPTVEAVDPEQVEQEVISLDELALASRLNEDLDAGDSHVLDEPDLGEDSVLKIDTDVDMTELESELEQLSSLTASIDASDASLDLDDAFDREATEEDAVEGLDVFDSGSADVANEDEVATKLDLARAYVEMGDSDGARSILEEVQDEGTDNQKAEAGKLLLQLAS